MRKIILVLPLLLAAACGGRGGAFDVSTLDTLYRTEYARGFTILRAGERSAILSIADPWQGARDVRQHLFLARGGERPPRGFDGVVVDAPLRKVVCMSSSYVAYIDALDETDAIAGVSGVRFVHNEKVRTQARDVGYDARMNYELIASLQPDMVFIYGLSGENSQLTDKLRELGVKYIYIGEYVEQSPLGRAEWLVAFGEMFNRRAAAEQIFARTSSSYNHIKKLAETQAARPRVILNAPYRDVWWMPGDRSYMVRLLQDAGGTYAGVQTDGVESRAVSGESAWVMALGADVWLNPGQAGTMRELMVENPRFGEVPAVRAGQVYNSTARVTPEGGSDFWESGAVRPDMVLKDLVGILHPGVLPHHELYYFKRLE